MSSRSLNTFLPYLGSTTTNANAQKPLQFSDWQQNYQSQSQNRQSIVNTTTQATTLKNHIVLLYSVPDPKVWNVPAHVMLPLIVFMKTCRKLTFDPVIILADRTEELLQLVPEVNTQDPLIFSNVELIKGNPRHLAHLHQVGCENAQSIVMHNLL